MDTENDENQMINTVIIYMIDIKGVSSVKIRTDTIFITHL